MSACTLSATVSRALASSSRRSLPLRYAKAVPRTTPCAGLAGSSRRAYSQDPQNPLQQTSTGTRDKSTVGVRG